MFFNKVPLWIQKSLFGLVWSAEGMGPLLTFDDGPHPDTTPWILDHLDQRGVKGLFFLIGENVERYPYLMEEIIQRGHQVGNHGYRHLRGWTISVDQFVANVDHGAQVTGSSIFRPPYGQIGWRQYRAIRANHHIMMWSIMPGDFVEGVDINKTVQKVNQIISPKDIVVLHDNPMHFERMKEILVDLDFS